VLTIADKPNIRDVIAMSNGKTAEPKPACSECELTSDHLDRVSGGTKAAANHPFFLVFTFKLVAVK
jgi:hypothetical protein